MIGIYLKGMIGSEDFIEDVLLPALQQPGVWKA
jgi:hypothetical protein